jgi:NAD(P)-dependent dehydrogenase (short-subunit alcohol dehydrogenase family)
VAGAGQGGEPSTGRIINTTSGAGLSGNFGQSNYATAKAAIVGLTLTSSLELYRMGITVNAEANLKQASSRRRRRQQPAEALSHDLQRRGPRGTLCLSPVPAPRSAGFSAAAPIALGHPVGMSEARLTLS